MRALQQLGAQSAECKFAAIHRQAGDDLGSDNFLQLQPRDVQGAVRLKSEQRRRALLVVRIQDAVPRTFRRMRRKELGEIRRRKMIGRQIKLKQARGSAMAWSGDGASPVRRSGLRRKFLHGEYIGTEQYRGGRNFNGSV